MTKSNLTVEKFSKVIVIFLRMFVLNKWFEERDDEKVVYTGNAGYTSSNNKYKTCCKNKCSVKPD